MSSIIGRTLLTSTVNLIDVRNVFAACTTRRLRLCLRLRLLFALALAQCSAEIRHRLLRHFILHRRRDVAEIKVLGIVRNDRGEELAPRRVVRLASEDGRVVVVSREAHKHVQCVCWQHLHQRLHVRRWYQLVLIP